MPAGQTHKESSECNCTGTGCGLIANFISAIFKAHDQNPFCKATQRSPSTPSAQSCGDSETVIDQSPDDHRSRLDDGPRPQKKLTMVTECGRAVVFRQRKMANPPLCIWILFVGHVGDWSRRAGATLGAGSRGLGEPTAAPLPTGQHSSCDRCPEIRPHPRLLHFHFSVRQILTKFPNFFTICFIFLKHCSDLNTHSFKFSERNTLMSLMLSQ